VEPPGGESGNIEHAWGMYNKHAGCSTHAYEAPHNNNNNNNNNWRLFPLERSFKLIMLVPKTKQKIRDIKSTLYLVAHLRVALIHAVFSYPTVF
jgi:hypothetical protein